MRSLTWKEINKIFQTLYGEQGMDIFSQNYNIDNGYTGSGYEENYSLLTDLVWSQFYALLGTIKAIKPDNLDANDLTILDYRLRSWLKNYLILNMGESLTPYIHIFVFHVPKLLEKDNLNIYNMQGNEKLNDFITKEYHRATNKKRGSYLLQLMELRTRSELYNLGIHVSNL